MNNNPDRCSVTLWAIVRRDWQMITVAGLITLYALYALGTERYVPRPVYDKDQATTRETLREIQQDIKVLLQRGRGAAQP